MKKIKVLILIIAMMVVFTDSVYSLPVSVSNAQYATRIELQQGNTCVAYSLCNAVEAQLKAQGFYCPLDGFDKEWLYNRCIKAENKSNGDSVYLITALDIAMTDGLKYKGRNEYCKITSYKVISKHEIDDYLASGHFVVIGVSGNYADWEDKYISDYLGATEFYHCLFLTGYNDASWLYEGMNTWNDGKISITYEYLDLRCMQACVFEVGNTNKKWFKYGG